MAAVQEGILYVMKVSTSWSQGLKCTVLKRLTKTTSHHLLSKSNHNCRQQKKSFKSFSQHCLSISLSSVSNTGKRESPKPGQHKVAADSLHHKLDHWCFRRQTMQCKRCLKRFSNSSRTDPSCKPRTTWLRDGEQSTGCHCHEEPPARATASQSLAGAALCQGTYCYYKLKT